MRYLIIDTSNFEVHDSDSNAIALSKIYSAILSEEETIAKFKEAYSAGKLDGFEEGYADEGDIDDNWIKLKETL